MSSRVSPRLLTNLCYIAMMSLSIGLNLLPVFLTTLAVTYGGLTQEQLGRLGAFAFTGVVIGIVITGPMADRWGAKPFALLGNTLIAISLLGAAFAPTYNWLGFTLFFLGFGAGVLDMILSPVVSAINPTRRAAAMNWLHSFYCVGAVFTILLGVLVLGAGWGWRSVCLLLFPLPAVLVGVFYVQAFPSLTTEGGGTTVRMLVREKWFLLALVAIFLGGAAEMGMAQWLPAYAEKSLGYPVWMGGTSLLLFSVMMAIGRMIIGFLGTKLHPLQLMLWGCALSTGLFLAGSFLPVPSLALTACILVGFTGSCLWPTTLALTADRYPKGNASMFGLLAALGNAGGIFMPWVVGWIADRYDLHWGLAVSALAPALMLPLILLMRRNGGRGDERFANIPAQPLS